MKKIESEIIYKQKVFQIQDYIDTHLDQNLSLSRISKISAFSPFHFHRIFKKVSGETCNDFIQRVRVEKACSMLTSNADLKIINIALCTGFSTPSSFSKAFKKYTNMTPSVYRKKYSLIKGKNGTFNDKEGKEAQSPGGYISDNDLESLYIRRKEMNVKIEEIGKNRIAYMRQIGPYGTDNIQLMQRLKKWAVTRNLLSDSTIILGIAHDDPKVTPLEKCRYDTCIVIPEEYELESNINETRIPGGKYGIMAVEHTSEAIAEGWEIIFSQWLPESGYQLDDRPIFERYTGGSVYTNIEPKTCEICIPVRKL
ncbi:MAG: AraC family transcriptional regulator [Spirochaetales bacterium]|nr:AraC family transcriptional regulator [Spirochaetales bacterium]